MYKTFVIDYNPQTAKMIIPGSSEPPVRTLRATLRFLNHRFLYTVQAHSGVTTDKGGSPL
ncbi:hypothetical protein SAMN05216515_12524 [Eubacterium pyruvativorans]|uniref:Uncharacterized protein n=1 Tax=Eubacterium pyruvativorans TaxID=155865 RepID=A0A1I7HR34_9FIRM|nr:hypothetical protein SAMN05216515_12524 [Eubacterium pyruvativorans]SFU63215.1 hypothetical protein SAMN05216508_12225 [Eubacterium pyruvativorans]